MGVFQVDPVHFLLGQTLQQTEIFYRDDGGQVLPAAGDNRPLLCIGGAVNDVAIALPSGRAPILVASYLSDGDAGLPALTAAQADIGRLVARGFKS